MNEEEKRTHNNPKGEVSYSSQPWRWLERYVPAWGKILTAVILILGTLYTINDTVTKYVILPTALEAVEREQDQISLRVDRTETLMKFLVCHTLEQDQDRGAQGCIYILRDTPYFEEFRPFLETN